MQGKKLLILTLFLLFIPIFSVNAHANLQHSEPSTNARLEEVPEEIRLFFTEPLESQFSRIELHNAQGEKLDLPAAQLDADDEKQLILIPGDLADGVYTVAWRVVSQTDGHLTQGSFPITIGDANVNTIFLNRVEDNSIPWLSGVIRWYNLFSLAWLVGSIAFLVFIWSPSIIGDYPELEKRLRDFSWLAWESVGFASILILLLQAQIVSDESGLGIIDFIPQVISETRFGELWIMRIVLWVSFGILFWRMKQRPKLIATILLFVGGTILITQSLFSHASGAEAAVPSVVADWMHLLAMSFWIGSLIQFVLVIKSIQSTNRLSVMVARFSNMARVCVTILVITGFYAGWLHIGSVDALLTTPYGQALIIKLLLFLPLLAIAAINLFFTYRRLRANNTIWSQRLRYLISAEIVLTIAILFAVGIMTAIVPARITLASREEPREVNNSSENTFFQMAFEDDLMIHFTIQPGTVGENTFIVDLYSLEGSNEIKDASLIRLRFENEEQNTGESELRIDSLNDGRYSISGANLSSTGEWRIRMTVQRPNEFDAVIDFSPNISLPSPPTVTFNPAPDIEIVGFALLLTGFSGVIICGLFLTFIRPMAFNPQTILTVIFAVCSILLVQSGLQLRSSDILTNPIPVNTESIALGEELYMRNCSQCHGITGLGDGSVGRTLDPPPANLAIHTAPNGHSDGELFSWISDGFSRTSAMPAFKTVLSEEERWHLVNFIRTFGQ